MARRHIEESAQRILGNTKALSVGRATKEAPPGWTWVKLTDVARLESGHTPSRSRAEYWNGSIPWISIPDARRHHGGVINDTDEGTTPDGIENSAARVLPAGTVCLSRTASVGYTVVMGRPMATSQDFVNWICGPALEPKFLQLLFLAEGENLRTFGKGSTHTTIYFPEVLAFHVCLPPVGEQRRIVAKLEALLARSRRTREALDRVPTLLERLRQSVLTAAFRGDLTRNWREKHADVEPASKLLARIGAERRRRWEERELDRLRARGRTPRDNKWKTTYEEPLPVDASELHELPKGWAWTAWRLVGESQNGRPFPSSEYSTEGIKLLRPGNLHVSGKVVWTDNNTKCMPLRYVDENKGWIVGPNELVMNLTAQSLKDEFLGRVCLTGAEDRCLLNQRIARLSPIIVSPAFVMWLMKSPGFRKFVDDLNTGSLIQHMFTSQLDNWVFALPPLAEQTAILDTIRRHAATWERVAQDSARAADRLPSLEGSLLAKAFRGELVPQDPDDEPASAVVERLRAECVPAEKQPQKRRREAKVA